MPVEILFPTAKESASVPYSYLTVGTDHPQYAGMTWLELLERGKRMDINIPLLEKNPGYYTQAEQQHAGMSFVSTDGIHWYVSADGNHRSCLARFLFHLQGRGAHSFTMWPRVFITRTGSSGLPVGRFTT